MTVRSTDRFVIVGGGLAGGSAATQLRASGFDGDIVLYTAEAHLPYERPPLSKGYLLGREERATAFVHPPEWWAEHDVEVVAGMPVRTIDVAAHTLETDNGPDRFDRLLLATGARPRRLPIPGADASNVHLLRTLDDSERLHRALAGGGQRVVVVGSGWIGLEAAAAARELGNEVTVVGMEQVPLEGPLGPEMGAMFRELHDEHGVGFRLGTSTRAFRTEGGRAIAVELDDDELPADLVIVGVGAAPDVALAEAAGLDVDNGVLVDAGLRTSAPDVFAAGDIANWTHPFLGERVRVEHWATAKESGRAAARSMLDEDVSFDHIPYFFTDQYDLGMEYAGFGTLAAGVEPVVRGDRAGREFIAFWLADGRVVAGMNVNVWDVTDQVQELIRSRRVVDPARLVDPGVELAAA